MTSVSLCSYPLVGHYHSPHYHPHAPPSPSPYEHDEDQTMMYMETSLPNCQCHHRTHSGEQDTELLLFHEQQQQQRRRVVRFAHEDCNEMYVNTQTTAEQAAAQWYTPQEYASFQQEMRNVVHKSRNEAEEQQQQEQTEREREQQQYFGGYYHHAGSSSAADQHEQHWREALWTVYKTFRTAKSPAQVQPVLDRISNMHTLCIDGHNVGLERLGMPHITRDFVMRRRALMEQVYMIQSEQQQQPPQRDYYYYNNNNNNHHHYGMDEEEESQYKALRLREAVEFYSHAARLYARYTAHLAAGLC